MDKSADGEAPTTVSTAAEEIQQQESSRVRRRLVQSTLLGHKSPAMETPGDQKDDKECNDKVKDGDDEECSGSRGKKKRTRKRKESPKTKTPKVSRKAKAVSSAEATPEKDATPKKSKRSSINAAGRKSATPKKNGTSVGKIADYLTENSDALLQIPNLRLEAKMVAEENSRVFGGKQIHPFFLSRNTSKIGQKTAIQIKSKSITVGPIHVFEREQDDAVSLDWRDWKFCEKFFTNSSFTPEGSFSSIFECTVKSLSFDEFPSVLHLTGSHFKDNKPSDECLPQQEFLYEASATAMSCGAWVECYQQIKDAEINYQVNEVGLLSGCARKSDAEHQTKILEERVSSHPDSANQLDNRLWTFKYQPKKAVEICGNHDSVKFLNEWLCTWHQRGYEASKASSVTDDECYMQDPDYNCSQSDSDSGNTGEEANFKNVLLITGPVGSGKSAAIYACAKEQGFRVLEFNTSDCRHGAAVKERFGVLDSQSTLDSQLLQWSQESPLEFQTMDTIKPPAAVQEIDGKVIEVIPIADEDISHEATETSEKFVYKDSSVPCSQGQLKLLILFEDVDVIFSEDRGFLTAIQQISDKVKWPVILTTNSDKPVLPDSLDRLELCFKMPLEKELFRHLCMVCSAENADVQPHQVEQLIKICQRDIRKIIMHLQFWCQGEQFIKGNEVRRLFSRLPFDLEDVYQILPKMIPWDFPSQLSELVEKEITMSLCMMEENGVSTVVITDDKDMHNHIEKHICETDSIEAKKKVMLSNNCSDHDTIDFIPPFNLACDFFDSSNSPFPSSRKNSKRKLVVMSSDSEDDRVPTSLEKDISNGFFLENGGFAPHHPNFQIGFSPSTDLQLYSESEKLEENLYLCSETAVHLDVKNTCISVDVSCVPESSYVPETEIDDGTRIFGRVSCGQMGQAEIIEETSVSNEFRQNVLSVDAKNFDEPMPKLCKDSDLLVGTCDMTAVSSHEEVEDSQNDLTESITREHQLMDECSCMNFSRKFNQHQKRGSSDVIDTVQESWRKLRDRRADLRHLAAAEHKYCSGIMKLACGMSNLISEAEVLQTKCQSLDSLGLPMVFSEESEAFSWGNEQLQMASTIVQHGFCTYAKDIVAAGLNMGYRNNGDLTWEVLSATTKMKVSNSLGQNVNAKNLHVGLDAEMTLLENGSSNSEQKSQSINIIQSVVPSRAYMTMKGDALYEYRSSLACISRSESSRLSEGDSKTRRRRGRAARNYLSTGSLMLSPEEISLLGQSSMHGKISPQSLETKY